MSDRALYAKQALILGVVFTALTFAFTAPFSFHLWSRILAADSDGLFVRWILLWDVHAFTHQPFHIFDSNAFAPLTGTLAFAENMIGSALLAAPVIWLTGNVALALNLLALASIPLSGVGTFLIGRRVGLSTAAAALAALIYAFTPSRFLRVDQIQITTLQWMPFCLAFLHAYFNDGRSRDLKWALGFFTMQALTSGHGSVFLGMGVIAMLIYRFALGEPIRPLQRLRDVGVTGALLLLPTFLMYLPYRRAQREMGLERDLAGWRVPPLSDFVATSSYVHEWAFKFYPPIFHDKPDAYLFPGYLPILILAAGLVALTLALVFKGASGRDRFLARIVTLAAIALAGLGVWTSMMHVRYVRLLGLQILTARHPSRIWIEVAAVVLIRLAMIRRVPIGNRMAAMAAALRSAPGRVRRNWAVFYTLVLLWCAWLMMGPPYSVWQYAYKWPVLNFVRQPTRFVLLALLAIAVLAGFVFDRFTRRWSPRAATAAAGVLSVLCLVEFAGPPLTGRPMGDQPGRIDQWLRTVPDPVVVAELPMPSPDWDGFASVANALYMVHSTAHWHKTVHGFSGILPEEHSKLYDSMFKFPDAESMRRLDAFHVTHLVVHADFTSAADRDAWDRRLAPYAYRLKLLHEEPDGRVYQLLPP